MESKSGSNQTLWDFLRELVLHEWGGNMPDRGLRGMAVTIVLCRTYLDRFGRLPPREILATFVTTAVNMSKKEPGLSCTSEFSDQTLFNRFTGGESYMWSRTYRVRDFDS